MPVCFCLYPKNSTEAQRLQDVDSRMREYFGQPQNDDEWLGDWYASIGLRVALGRSFNDIREEFERYVREEQDCPVGSHKFYTDALRILEWLSEFYTTECWRSV